MVVRPMGDDADSPRAQPSPQAALVVTVGNDGEADSDSDDERSRGVTAAGQSEGEGKAGWTTAAPAAAPSAAAAAACAASPCAEAMVPAAADSMTPTPKTPKVRLLHPLLPSPFPLPISHPLPPLSPAILTPRPRYATQPRASKRFSCSASSRSRCSASHSTSASLSTTRAAPPDPSRRPARYARTDEASSREAGVALSAHALPPSPGLGDRATLPAHWTHERRPHHTQPHCSSPRPLRAVLTRCVLAAAALASAVLGRHAHGGSSNDLFTHLFTDHERAVAPSASHRASAPPEQLPR